MINLELALNDVNIILQALGQAPYHAVSELIEKVKEQAVPQAQALPKEDVVATAE